MVKLSYLRSVLRNAWLRDPDRGKALKNAYAMNGVNPETGRMVKLYTCARCGGVFPAKEVAVDHITPVGSLTSLDDLSEFAKKLFCDAERLQVLCKTCHNEKTRAERSNARGLRGKKGNP